jgi:release factor glutamine methyltransferase
MNANSKQPVPTTINDWLASSTHELVKANIPTARLDAELLLCHMLGVDRAWLIAHGEDSLTMSALSQKGGVRRGGLKEYGEKLLLRRLKREPLAYLFGHKEFYGRDFIVSKDVLIPRPETESLIELAKKHALTGNLLDVGTGSGAIGLTLSLELDAVALTLSDISPEALEVAKKNAKKLRVKTVEFIESDLMEHWSDANQVFDVIVANLPYVDMSWKRSPETRHEPSLALFADDGGLEFIKPLIAQAPALLTTGGTLLLEADPEQHPAIIGEASRCGFELSEQQDYGLLFRKTTT